LWNIQTAQSLICGGGVAVLSLLFYPSQEKIKPAPWRSWSSLRFFVLCGRCFVSFLKRITDPKERLFLLILLKVLKIYGKMGSQYQIFNCQKCNLWLPVMQLMVTACATYGYQLCNLWLPVIGVKPTLQAWGNIPHLGKEYL
jgi:hypothetical protein